MLQAMRGIRYWGGLGVALLLYSCHPARLAAPASPAPEPREPVAAVRPVELVAHGQKRVDDYYWLKERDDPEVQAYLEAENAYTDAVMGHTAALQESLFQEIKGRIQQTDSTAPVQDGAYLYYTRYVDGQEYPIFCRRAGSMAAPEQVMLDVNQLAEGHEYCEVSAWEVSSDQRLLAYALDTRGRRIHTVRFRDLTSGQDLPDQIPAVTGNITWAEDNRTLFYTRQDSVTLRWYQIYRHQLGTDPAQDPLVYQEDDDTFECYVYKTRSRRYLLIGSEQTLSTEFRMLEADQPDGQFRLIEPRRRDHEYHVDHSGDWLYIRTNDQARNFRLVRAPVSRPGQDHWEEVIPHRPEVLLEDFDLFRHHLVLEERRDGLLQIRVRRQETGDGASDATGAVADHYLDFGEPAYEAYVGTNEVFDTPVLRYQYSSMTTPDSDYDYDMDTRDKVLVKRQEVLGGFDPANYRTERLWATVDDSTRVPISIVYREGFPRDGSRPLLLYGYGSYGLSTNAYFSAFRISLLDRGFAYGIAHVRGGQELGRRWYEDGKLLKKRNTFTDFAACGEYLVAEGYTRPERLFAYGASAGGLLVGAVANLRPDLFAGIVADVPFVDVVTTMLDDSIPLTTSEYDEWGNPNEPEYYDYMMSYSPYDNVEAKAYPNLLVLTALHDSQVQYWEPAKWVARLRATRTDRHRLVLRTDMSSGHGGPSGRYQAYRETALVYAFLLDLVGITR
ncbi:MAG: S9 family peptidase [Gemmatimonadota bacterium]